MANKLRASAANAVICSSSPQGSRSTRPAFVSEREDWAVGDTFVAGPRRFRILQITDDNAAEVTAHLFAAIWTVEELPD